MRTCASAAATTGSGRPCASLPNSHATGPASTAWTPELSRSSAPLSRVVASKRTPAPRRVVAAARVSAPRTTGRWNRLPAVARTHFGLSGSTDSPARTTASAPTASAVRITVPALPGSATSTSTASSRGAAATTSASPVSSPRTTATTPCGVTVSDRLSATRSVTRVTRAPAGGLQALDEAVVGHAVGASGRVDALDPQRAEVALARAAVAIGIVERVEHLLLRLAVEPGPLAAVAAGPLENDATLLVGVDRPLYACHGRTPCIIRREAPVGTGSRSATEHLLGLLDVGRRELLNARETAGARRRLVLEVVPAVGALAQELAGPSDLEPLLRTSVRPPPGHF